MDKKRKILVATLGILSVLFITAGVSYAFFTYSRTGQTENSIKSGSITFWYDEVNRQGNSIGIVDALPISDTQGKAQTNAFNFRLVSSTSSSIAIPYTITLRQKEGTDNIGNKVKVYLAKTTGYDAAVNTEEELVTSSFSALTPVTHNGYSEKLLYTGSVPVDQANYNQSFRLKMWLDESTDLSNSDYVDKTFTITVNVYAEGEVGSSRPSLFVLKDQVLSDNTLRRETPDFTKAYPTLESYTDDNFTGTTSSLSKSNGYELRYHTYADSYTFDTATGKYTLVNPQVCQYSECYETLKGKYVTSYYGSTSNTADSSTNLSTIFKVANDTNNNMIYYISSTQTKNYESSLSGLYSMNVTDGFGGSDGTTYYFRGNVDNNYVNFADKTWRIVRINEDGTVRLVLNGRAGSYTQFNSTKNNVIYMYYSNSDLKTTIENWYSSNITGDNTTKVVTGNYFCEAAKTTYNLSYFNSGSANPTVYNSYMPDLTCNTDGNDKGLLNLNVGLINYDEIVLAGGYVSTLNPENYLSSGLSFSEWTMSPIGIYNNAAVVWRSAGANLNYGSVGNNDLYIRPVINLKADVTATGTGTSSDPYVIQ